MITAAMKPSEVTGFLVALGFSGLTLKTADQNKYTYKFVDVDVRALRSKLGAPTIASEGKVLVFQVPGKGRVGVSSAAHMLRFVDETSTETVETDDTHLGKLASQLPPELVSMYVVAQATASKRPLFLRKLWDWFNKNKFGNAMQAPDIQTGMKHASWKGKTVPRGFYRGGAMFTPGLLWMWSKAFNSKLDVLAEVFLHEMCVPGDTLISTELGEVPISQFPDSGARLVKTRIGYSPVERWCYSGEKPTMQIKTRSGSVLRITDNHKVLVKLWYGYRWIPAGQLCAGDILVRSNET